MPAPPFLTDLNIIYRVEEAEAEEEEEEEEEDTNVQGNWRTLQQLQELKKNFCCKSRN
jgi:hypothetical protein